jgi:hypothetical protein
LTRQLVTPKSSLVTNPEGLKGYLDFHVLENNSIEMELLERSDDDFATVDISTAAHVVKIALTDTQDLPLRSKLEGLSINWLT